MGLHIVITFCVWHKAAYKSGMASIARNLNFISYFFEVLFLLFQTRSKMKIIDFKVDALVLK